MKRDYHIDGALRERRDDTTRTVTTYDATGAVTSTRPYTASENAAADQTAIQEQARLAYEATRQAIKAIVTDLQAEKDRVQVVLDKTNANITAADTKNVARAAKRIADATIDLARFVKDMQCK